METVKLCECGCGKPAPLAKGTDKRVGHTLGQPLRFVHGHHMKKAQPSLELIYAKVTENSGGCWVWGGNTNRQGYGRIFYRGKMVLLHRLTYVLKNGAIPDGKILRHQCDNPPCCNPQHLLTGTRLDNALDAVERGRTAKGTRSGLSKLTEEQVLEIRASSESQKNLADRYGVSATIVSLAQRGKTWKHVGGLP